MNRKLVFASAWAVAAGLGATPALAADCKVGSQQTVSGVMSEAVDTGDGNWLSMRVENAQPCSVSTVTGKGRVPTGCGFGEYFGNRKFTATGLVEDGAIGPLLRVTTIRCSS